MKERETFLFTNSRSRKSITPGIRAKWLHFVSVTGVFNIGWCRLWT